MELLIFAVPMLLVWFLFIRPQQKRMREQQELTQQAGIGDVVATAGGFIVTVMDEPDPDDDSNGLAPDEVLVAMADGVEVVMLRRSIAQIRERWDGQYADGTYADDDLDRTDTVDSPTDADPSDGPVDGD